MLALRDLQQAFGAAMLAEDDAVPSEIVEDGFTAAERLRIYRNTYRSTLTEALRTTYPAVDRLVGRDFFDTAAAQFIAGNQPASADLNEYGESFAEFVADFAPASSHPYLADVARFEWALSVAANADDATVLNPHALGEIPSEHHDALRFEAHPSVRFLALTYPADEIADAVLAADDAAMAQIDLSSGPVWLAVHRGRDGIGVERLGPQAYDFLRRLCGGETLGVLVQTAPPEAPALLAENLTKGRLMAFRVGA